MSYAPTISELQWFWTLASRLMLDSVICWDGYSWHGTGWVWPPMSEQLSVHARSARWQSKEPPLKPWVGRGNTGHPLQKFSAYWQTRRIQARWWSCSTLGIEWMSFTCRHPTIATALYEHIFCYLVFLHKFIVMRVTNLGNRCWRNYVHCRM